MKTMALVLHENDVSGPICRTIKSFIKRNAHSYIRFSSLTQAAGDSAAGMPFSV
jgi:hypothetical protein